MDRKEFLKFLGIGSAGLLLPSGTQFHGSGLLSRSVKIYDNHIKGVEYYDLGKCYKNIQVGDAVILQRFQEHRYDRFAIGIQWESFFLGYIPAFENIVLANYQGNGRVKVVEKRNAPQIGEALNVFTTE